MEIDRQQVLLTVDFEGGDRGLPTPDGSLAELTDRLLGFLKRNDARATFFVVGAVAQESPELIERIAAAGHEIALHTCRHDRLAELGRAGFEADVDEGLEVLAPFCEEGRPVGFRAPFFSVSEDTSWLFDVLKSRGFLYDSSILPVRNPVCGDYPGQSKYVSQLENGLWSVPVSVFRLTNKLGVPVAGGVYLRLLPMWLHRWAARRYDQQGEPLNLYVHPYDIQEDAPTGDVFRGNALLNSLLRMRREQMLPRLGEMIDGRHTWRVVDYIRHREGALSPNGR